MSPLSEGGEDTLDDLVTICVDCHRNYRWQEIIRLGEHYKPSKYFSFRKLFLRKPEPTGQYFNQFLFYL
jgi:hypothetical protein